jgi:hypothetical protein
MKILAAMALALFYFSSSLASGEDAVWRQRIAVSVTCNDGALRSEITSFISRELRGLGDVDITDDNPSFKISVVAMSVKMQNGYDAGYAFSVIITSPLGDWSWALSDKLNSQAKASIAQLFQGHESLEDDELVVGNNDDLRQNLTEIIAKFDANSLEPRRKLWQKFKDSKN